MKEINELLAVTKSLRLKYKKHGKQFTLDGKLVGDIGEVLAAEKYGLQLLGENERVHDAREEATGRLVQIKSTFKGYCYFPFGEPPEMYLCLQLDNEGGVSEIFNGPGAYVKEHYIEKDNIQPYKSSYYTLSKSKLMRLSEQLKQANPTQRVQEVKYIGTET